MKELLEKLIWEAVNSLRVQAWVPYDTGNLKFNAIRGVWIGENTFQLYVDESIAPYMKYTNEPWKGKGKNPNENWWERAFKYICDYLQTKLKGINIDGKYTK